MANLPQEPRSWCVQHAVEKLMLEAEAAGRYARASRAIVRAALDLMLAGPRWAQREQPANLVEHDCGWRLNDWEFYVPPRLDDEAMLRALPLSRRGRHVDLLVPPGAQRIANAAITALLPARIPVAAYGIDDYVGLRVLLTTMDCEMRGARLNVDLWTRYAELMGDVPHIDACASGKGSTDGEEP